VKNLEMVGMILVIVGALNWGLVGLGGLMGQGNWNLVEMVLGGSPMLVNLVYLLVGVSGVWMLKGWMGKSKK
jgi:hypothetical protein